MTDFFGKETLDAIMAIEQKLWTNNPDIYHDTYTADAVLIFPEVGRLDRETAVAAIRKENAEGRAWAEVDLGEVEAQWILRDAAGLVTYVATARWNYENAASKTICATVYVDADDSWKVAFHQQTRISSEYGA